MPETSNGNCRGIACWPELGLGVQLFGNWASCQSGLCHRRPVGGSCLLVVGQKIEKRKEMGEKGGLGEKKRGERKEKEKKNKLGPNLRK